MNLKWCSIAIVWALVALSTLMAQAALTGEYLFENSDLSDTSPSDKDGTAIGTTGLPSFGPGLYTGSSVSLRLNSDGTTVNQANAQRVQLPDSSNFVTNATGATLTAWIKLEGSGGANNRTILSVANGANAARATIQIANGTFRALGRKDDSGNSSTTSAITPNVGQVYFVAGVFNYTGGYVRLFVDGVQVANANVPAWNTTSANTANLTTAIGNVSNPAATAEYWPGLIDGARIFNSALTNQDILGLFQNPNVVPNPFKLGDTDNNGIVNAADLTPIRQNYLQSVTMRSQGDLTGDNQVTFADFREWKTAILAGGGSLAEIDLSFVAVPEPSTIMLAVVAIGGILSVRRGRNMTAAAAVTAALVLHTAAAEAAISVTPDPAVPVGANVATVDPLTAPTGGNIGLADTRMIRQTFKNPATFNVGTIITAFDVTGGVGGFNISFYEVNDVNAVDWASTGVAASPLHSLAFPGNLPGTTNRLQFNLSGSDVFSLPARNTSTQGYAIVFQTVDQVSNPGQFRHSNTATTDVDLYVDGRHYTHTGAAESAGVRDLGIWLLGPDLNLPGPGDVDGVGGVTLTDLDIIASHFRQSGNRSQGDLTGDGFIDIFDFRDWKSHYPGANSGSGGLSDFEDLFGVPEPASAALAASALMACGWFRRRANR